MPSSTTTIKPKPPYRHILPKPVDNPQLPLPTTPARPPSEAYTQLPNGTAPPIVERFRRIDHWVNQLPTVLARSPPQTIGSRHVYPPPQTTGQIDGLLPRPSLQRTGSTAYSLYNPHPVQAVRIPADGSPLQIVDVKILHTTPEYEISPLGPNVLAYYPDLLDYWGASWRRRDAQAMTSTTEDETAWNGTYYLFFCRVGMLPPNPHFQGGVFGDAFVLKAREDTRTVYVDLPGGFVGSALLQEMMRVEIGETWRGLGLGYERAKGREREREMEQGKEKEEETEGEDEDEEDEEEEEEDKKMKMDEEEN